MLSVQVIYFGLALTLTLLATACIPSKPNVTPAPSLNASLWVDFPSLRMGQQQAVNVTINDPAGNPVAAATVVCVIEAPGYKETLTLPLTDSEGRSRLALTLPIASAIQAYTVTVTVVDSAGRWDKAETQFEVYP